MLRDNVERDSWKCYEFFTLGAHAQEGYGACPVCLSVCLSVCPSVHLIIDIVRFYGLPKVYVQHSFRLFFIFNAWIFEKNFRWKVMARKMPICK